MRQRGGLIQIVALLGLALTLGVGTLVIFTRYQAQALEPTQQAYAYKMVESDAKRLIQAGQLLSRGDSVDAALERLGKPNATVNIRQAQTTGEIGVTQEMHYILASREPIVPYTPHAGDTAVIVGIGQDKKVAYIKFVNITGAIPGFRSDQS